MLTVPPSSPQKSTEHMKKIPTIILSITYKGVKFIDASTKVSCRGAGRGPSLSLGSGQLHVITVTTSLLPLVQTYIRPSSSPQSLTCLPACLCGPHLPPLQVPLPP